MDKDLEFLTLNQIEPKSHLVQYPEVSEFTLPSGLFKPLFKYMQ